MKTKKLLPTLLVAALSGCGTAPTGMNNCVPGAADSTGNCLQMPDLSKPSGADMGGSSCTAPSTSCNGSCIDVTSNNANCGTCGMTCANGSTCMAGKCTTPMSSCNPLPQSDAPDGMVVEKFEGEAALQGITHWNIRGEVIDAQESMTSGCTWLTFNGAAQLMLPSGKVFCGQARSCYVNCGKDADSSNICVRLTFSPDFKSLVADGFLYENRVKSVSGTPDKPAMSQATRE